MQQGSHYDFHPTTIIYNPSFLCVNIYELNYFHKYTQKPILNMLRHARVMMLPSIQSKMVFWLRDNKNLNGARPRVVATSSVEFVAYENLIRSLNASTTEMHKLIKSLFSVIIFAAEGGRNNIIAEGIEESQGNGEPSVTDPIFSIIKCYLQRPKCAL